MRKVILLNLLVLTSFVFSAKFVQIGQVNMISNRNVNPTLNYQSLSTFKGSSEKEIQRSKCKTIEEAIEQTVKSVPGGEFLMNAKIFVVSGKYYAVQGDVWGNAENQSFKGFKVGDVVTWKVFSIEKASNIYKKGTITALKSDKECLVKVEETGKTIDLEYDKISKSE
jgi:hypothetical protein